MIQISQEEQFGFNILNAQLQNNMAEVKRLQAAIESYIKLLERKYKAVFNQETRQLEPKKKEK